MTFRIYRIKTNDLVEWVDTVSDPGNVITYIKENYLYDSAEGEQYFVLREDEVRVYLQVEVRTQKVLFATTAK